MKPNDRQFLLSLLKLMRENMNRRLADLVSAEDLERALKLLEKL